MAGSDKTVTVRLARRDLETLLSLAHYYERSLGPMRHLVRLTGSRETRQRFRYVAEEGKWVQRFIESALRDMKPGPEAMAQVHFTLRTLVACWGRILATLNTRRARRKLSAEDVAQREALEERLREALRPRYQRDRTLVEAELATRRPVEVEWMRQLLD